MTTAEYLQTPETVLPQELAYGVLRVAEAPSISHQRVVGEMFIALTRHVRSRRLGEVLVAPVDVILDAESDLVVQPDILFVSNAAGRLTEDRLYSAPDLVVEVLSPNPRIGAVNEKVGWYARYGVRECWLASLPKKEIEVLTFADAVVAERTVCARAQSLRSRVLGDLELTPLDIFGW